VIKPDITPNALSRYTLAIKIRLVWEQAVIGLIKIKKKLEGFF
jgi:hypothetical protein